MIIRFMKDYFGLLPNDLQYHIYTLVRERYYKDLSIVKRIYYRPLLFVEKIDLKAFTSSGYDKEYPHQFGIMFRHKLNRFIGGSIIKIGDIVIHKDYLEGVRYVVLGYHFVDYQSTTDDYVCCSRDKILYHCDLNGFYLKRYLLLARIANNTAIHNANTSNTTMITYCERDQIIYICYIDTNYIIHRCKGDYYNNGLVNIIKHRNGLKI